MSNEAMSRILLTSVCSVIALSKLYSLNDSRLAQTQVKGDLIVNNDDGLIKTRSRAKQSKSPATHHH